MVPQLAYRGAQACAGRGKGLGCEALGVVAHVVCELRMAEHAVDAERDRAAAFCAEHHGVVRAGNVELAAIRVVCAGGDDELLQGLGRELWSVEGRDARVALVHLPQAFAQYLARLLLE